MTFTKYRAWSDPFINIFTVSTGYYNHLRSITTVFLRYYTLTFAKKKQHCDNNQKKNNLAYY